MHNLAVHHGVDAEPVAEVRGRDFLQPAHVFDSVIRDHRVDAVQIGEEKFALGQIALHRPAQPLRVGPGPSVALLAVTKRQGNLVHHEIGAALIGKGQHRDSRRWIAQVLGSYIDLETARIELNDPVEQGLAAVAFQVILLLKEWPLLVVVVNAASHAQDGQNQDQQNTHAALLPFPLGPR